MNPNLLNEQLQFQLLTEVPGETIFPVFNAAFSDYVVPMHMTLPNFLSRMDRVGYDAEISAGAFCKGQMGGFILNANGSWQGQKTAYNSGTGVIPAFRGNKLTQKIYHYLYEKLRAEKFELALLEVITQNMAAYKAYNGLGFQKTRLLNCFQSPKSLRFKKKADISIQLARQETPNWATYATFKNLSPSWQNETGCLQRNFAELTLVEAYHKTQTTGYILFNADLGRIDQFGVHPEFRQKGIGRQLIRAAMEMSQPAKVNIINIEDGSTTDIFLKKLGFEIRFQQYEMMLDLAAFPA